MEVPLQIIRHFVRDNRKKLLPIAAGAVLGGLLYYYHQKLLRLDQKQKKHHSGILGLPTETREYIWDHLSYEDILNLRLVCYDFKTDVDTRVGVHGHLSCEEESYSFFRGALLTKCLITDLKETSDERMLGSPYHLMHLIIEELKSLPLGTVQNLLRDCNNLQKLNMKFSSLDERAILDTESLSRIVLESLRTKLKLTEFDFIKIPSYTKAHKIFVDDTSVHHFPVTTLLTDVEILLPDVPASHLGDWKHLLEQQSNLSTLVVNFGGVHWNFFFDIITKNASTLRMICLNELKCFNESIEDITPFDWRIFRDCKNLVALEITGFQWNLGNMSSNNFYEIPTEKLTKLVIKQVILSRNDVRKIYLEMPKLESTECANVGVQGDRAVEEIGLQYIHNELRRAEQLLTQQTIQMQSDYDTMEKMRQELLELINNANESRKHYEEARRQYWQGAMQHLELTFLRNFFFGFFPVYIFGP